LAEMIKMITNELEYKQIIKDDFWLNKKKGKTLIIVFSTNQGFCGSFNQAITNKAGEEVARHPNALVKVFGKKSSNIDERAECIQFEDRFDIAKSANTVSELVFNTMKLEDTGKILTISGAFKSVMSQGAVCKQIFPLPSLDDGESHKYIGIEGDRLAVLESLFCFYIRKVMVSTVTDHLVSEFSARVMAMDNSVRNAKDMQVEMNIMYNRIRQAKITQELTEIVSSMECVH
jgi:F-type H+-transporting ATPase subunit gamma